LPAAKSCTAILAEIGLEWHDLVHARNLHAIGEADADRVEPLGGVADILEGPFRRPGAASTAVGVFDLQVPAREPRSGGESGRAEGSRPAGWTVSNEKLEAIPK
jgi:hypothetical protein